MVGFSRGRMSAMRGGWEGGRVGVGVGLSAMRGCGGSLSAMRGGLCVHVGLGWDVVVPW